MRLSRPLVVSLLLGTLASGPSARAQRPEELPGPPPPALAAGFAQAFTPAAVASYLSGEARKLLVAAAGDDSRAAATAIEGALRASGRVQLVMDDAALGAISKLDDQAIAKRCTGLPIDAVAVVRVFPSAGGAATAVVTLYDKQGQTLGGFSAAEGTPLSPQGPPATAAQGVPADAVGMVSQVLKKERDANSKAQQEYDEHFLGLDESAVLVVHRGGGAVLPAWGPYEGRTHHPLSWPEFYERAGHADLAESYEHKRALRRGLFIAAGTIMGLSLISGFGLSMGGGPGSQYFVPGIVVVSLGLPLGGGLMIAAGLSGPRQTLETGQQARSFAEEHNRRLRNRLGLQDSAPVERSGSLYLAPMISASGGGLQLSLRY